MPKKRTKKSTGTRASGASARKPVILLPGRNPDELRLDFAGNIVKHLGVQMYAGRPVPAIAELISNAWDADAVNVKVKLPLDKAWDPTDENETIVVEDDGKGMSWDEIREAYLRVGRDSRKHLGTDRTPGGRPMQGRKGVGKLAGFGIADVVEIQTVRNADDPSIREPALIWFRLAYPKLAKSETNAPAEVIYAGPVSKAPSGGRKKHGTTVILRHLHSGKAVNGQMFHWSMAQRFLLIGKNFHVTINGEDLGPEKVKLQWRWPKKQSEWEEDVVKGCGPVKYWIGFTPKPRKQNEGEQAGLLIYTRGKVAQEETFFEISGGVTGQHGLRYMVGQIQAEWLDAGVDEPDLVATPRNAIAWESPTGQAFKQWGQALVKKMLAEWAKLRKEERRKAVREVSPQHTARIDMLDEDLQDVANQFIDKFSDVEMEVAEFQDLLDWFLGALENATLLNIIKKLRESDEKDLKELDDLLNRIEIRTAVSLLQIVQGNLAAIDTLENMHLTNAKERGVIAKHLERNPWLIEPTWMLNKAEGRVITWLQKEFGLPSDGEDKDNKDRADFFCVGVGGILHIVEIKRGSHVAKADDFLQADKYRKFILKRFGELSDPNAIKYPHVVSHLVAAQLHDDAEGIKTSYQNSGWVYFTTWDDLVDRAKLSHQQYRDELQARTKAG